jgi:hypothetical protein
VNRELGGQLKDKEDKEWLAVLKMETTVQELEAVNTLFQEQKEQSREYKEQVHGLEREVTTVRRELSGVQMKWQQSLSMYEGEQKEWKQTQVLYHIPRCMYVCMYV